MTRPLHDALEETLGFIQRALDRIQAGEAGEAELHNVRAYLLNILELVDRDPGMEAASDDLYAVAKSSLAAQIAVRACPSFCTRRSCASVTASDRQGPASRRER